MPKVKSIRNSVRKALRGNEKSNLQDFRFEIKNHFDFKEGQRICSICLYRE